MFSRSAIRLNQTDAAYKSALIDGKEKLTVKASADNSPPRLAIRIAEGEDLLAIWLDWESQSALAAISQKIGFNLASSKDREAQEDLSPIYQMEKSEILDFCKAIKVHPAHLMPLKVHPEFSLPAPLLELLIDMTHGQGKFLGEDIELARFAVDTESKRIGNYLYYQSIRDQSKGQEGSKPVTLTQVFSSVLDNPELMRKLAFESTYLNVVLEQNVHVHYPIATRIKNYALYGLEQTIKMLKKEQAQQESLLNAAFDGVKTSYTQIFYPRASERVLFFIADIKDELLSKDIEPNTATTYDILSVLNGFDFTDSSLQKACRFFNDAYEGVGMMESSQDTLKEMAENLELYFASEYKASETRRKASDKVKALPSANDIEALFQEDQFKEGKLFRRLMDNHVIIALASHEKNRTQPTAAP